ncbi:uncharacterized protein LOC115991067 [Quercus lobata]|uniref:uncharacterized protein LOC115991067 n=1 Tax=Quercus lobata TaxID=97700 RepID=UPI001246418C|nr:uncharacterized protein LOC115991067 [Quercus lobata]
MALWVIELSEFDIQYCPWMAIEGQAVADFITGFTLGEGHMEEEKEQWKVGLTSYRVECYDKDKNKEAIRLQLDLVDEVRAATEQSLAHYQNLMAKHYNNKVRHRDFRVGDLVLRRVMGAAKDPSQGKLGPNWEGPYRIASWQRKGTYHLETMDGQKLQHPWNTEHLRKYYQ